MWKKKKPLENINTLYRTMKIPLLWKMSDAQGDSQWPRIFWIKTPAQLTYEDPSNLWSGVFSPPQESSRNHGFVRGWALKTWGSGSWFLGRDPRGSLSGARLCQELLFNRQARRRRMGNQVWRCRGLRVTRGHHQLTRLTARSPGVSGDPLRALC